jgi:hypothetical protein
MFMATLRNDVRSFGITRDLVLFSVFLLIAYLSYGQTKNSCLDCHSALPEPLGVSQEKFSQDIHAQKGLTYSSCHGGDPTNDDPTKGHVAWASYRPISLLASAVK